MTEQKALELLKQGDKPGDEVDFTYEEFLESIDVAMKALEKQIKLKECIANLDNPEFENLTWSHKEVLKLLKEHTA